MNYELPKRPKQPKRLKSSKSQVLFHKNSPPQDLIKKSLHIMALSYYEVTATTQKKGPKILFPIRCHLLKRKRDLVHNMTYIENIY